MGIKWCQLPCQAGSNVLQWWVSECKRVRGQRLQQEKAHALVALDYKAPLTAAREKKWQERWEWDVEESWRIIKGRIEWARDHQMHWIRLRSRWQIGTKKADTKQEKTEEWRGNGVKMEQISISSFSPSIATQFGNRILNESCRCSRYIMRSITNTNIIVLIIYLGSFFYFDPGRVFESEYLL